MICDAIAQRMLLEFDYDRAHRVVEPHCFGISSKGHRLLRAFQVAGQSAGSGELGWKLFDEEKIVGLRLGVGTFSPRPDYNPNDERMTSIVCRL